MRRCALTAGLWLATLVFGSAEAQVLNLTATSGDVTPNANGTTDLGLIEFFPDNDRDGMSDIFETLNDLDPNDPSDASTDADGDGLTNLAEFLNGTNPLDEDTDGDGFSDGDEAVAGTDPLDPDSNPGVPLPPIVELSVTPSVSTLMLNPFAGDATLQLTAEVEFADGTKADVTGSASGTTYLSNNPAVATVGPAGFVQAQGDGFTTIDVRNGAFEASLDLTVASFTPQALAFVPIPGFANNVDVSDRHAYVAAGSTGLQVVDVTVPSAAAIVAARNTPGNANDVVVQGNIAYVADGSQGLQLIDISDPTAPAIVAQVDTPGTAFDVDVSGAFAYVADGASGLQVVDVSDPTTPGIIGSVDTPGAATGVAVNPSLGLAVVADGSSGVQVVDVSEPGNPELRGVANTPGGASDVAISGIFAFVADGCSQVGGLQVVDISNPDLPAIIGASSVRFNACDVALVGDVAVFAENIFVNAAPFVDIGNPIAPGFLGAVDFSGAPSFRDDNGTGLDLTESLLFLTGARGTLQQNGTVGNTGLHIARYVQFNDNGISPPVVTIVNPGPAVMGSTFDVTVDAFDDVFVSQASLSVDGVAVGPPDTQAPFQFPVTVPASLGSFVLTGTATDLAGNVGLADPVTVQIVDDLPPLVEIAQPGVGSSVVENIAVTIEADASDDIAVVSVTFLVDGAEIGTDTNSPFTAVFTPPSAPAELAIQALATDTAGQTATALRVVDVQPDTPPTVSITLPIDGTEVVAGTNVNFTAVAADDLGVDAVRYVDAGDLSPLSGDLPTPPFAFAFAVPPGAAGTSVQVAAIARDSGGQETTSDVVTLFVEASQAPMVDLLLPVDGSELVEGETITLSADASDDLGFVTVDFVVNGVLVSSDSSPPFEVPFVVPLGETSLAIDAVARDVSDQTASDSHLVSVIPDPLTTVIGTAFDQDGLPAEGALARVRFPQFMVEVGSTSIQGGPLVVDPGTGIGRSTLNGTLPSQFGALLFGASPIDLSLASPLQVSGTLEADLTGFDPSAPTPVDATLQLSATSEDTTLQLDFAATLDDFQPKFGTFLFRSDLVVTVVDGGGFPTIAPLAGQDVISRSQGTVAIDVDASGAVAALDFDFAFELLATPLHEDTVSTDGSFLIPDVPTIFGDIVVDVDLVDPVGDDDQQGSSAPVPPVRGGVTDVGRIDLSIGVFYQADFVQGVTAVQQCTDWIAFRAELVGRSFNRITLRGSRDPVGVSCTGSVANTLCQAIAEDLRIPLVACDGRNWAVGQCAASGRGVEISANGSICQCSSGYVARPCIRNLNWGGINGPTCGAFSQTIEVICD